MVSIGGQLATAGKLGNKINKYHERIDKAKDLYHNFPRSFDSHIIQNGTWAQRIKDKADWYEMSGSINGTEGIYQIGINEAGMIFHRNFVPNKKNNIFYGNK